jgi:hypothetical protein
MRRALLQVLSDSGSPLSGLIARTVMDDLLYSTTWTTFLNCVAYLSGEGLLCVYPITASGELSIFEQEKYLSLLRQATYDSPEAGQMMLRIRQLGRRFLEGNEPTVKGVA